MAHANSDLPRITAQPQHVAVSAGANALFSVTATGPGPLSYQWHVKTKYEGAEGEVDEVISWATNATMLATVRGIEKALVRVEVSNTNGAVFSSWANLSVIPGTLLSFKTSLGNMDVQLFDYDKPLTVTNFLSYVRSNLYTTNLFFHRLTPHAQLFGGGYRGSSKNTNLFSGSQPVAALPGIPNESLVGSRVGNEYGTLAMAPTTTNNLAASEWFFNLENNPNLDIQNGGHAVFGRLVQGTNELEGVSVLQKFNNRSMFDGIVDMSFFQAKHPFTSLPVTHRERRAPRNDELIYVDISIAKTGRVDTVKPKVAIAFPTPDARLTNGVFTLRGTASDNLQVARVFYRIGNAPHEVANGTTNWSVDLDLPLGVHTVAVQSVDLNGNFSRFQAAESW